MSNLKNNRVGRLKKKLAPRIVAAFKAIGYDALCPASEVYFRRYRGICGGFVARIGKREKGQRSYPTHADVTLDCEFTMSQAIRRGFTIGPLTRTVRGSYGRQGILKP